MRVGNVILLPLVALIGFGFCLAYNINLARELIEIRDQLARVEAERQALETQYQNLVEEKNHLMEQLSGLTGENADLRLQLETVESERKLLSGQVDTLQNKLESLQQANSLLVWLVQVPAGRLTAAILILPIVPLSFGALYVMTASNRTRPIAPANRNNKTQGTIQATLSREEFHLIAQHRRSRAL